MSLRAGEGKKKKYDGALLVRIVIPKYSNANRNGRLVLSFERILETYFMPLTLPPKRREKTEYFDWTKESSS